MLEIIRNFVFKDIYDYAALVEVCAENSGGFIELALETSPDLLSRLHKPSKLSILHVYIYSMIRVEQSREYLKHSDLYDKSNIERLEKLFHEYGISVVPFKEFNPNLKELQNEVDDDFYRWFIYNEDNFLWLWEKITDEIFHILFSNRRFLLQFNRSLSEYLQAADLNLPDGVLSEDGYIRRCPRIPSWLKKAVFYRDQGRCVFCRKDLSGLLATDRRLNFDHMVPLAGWGTNDPSNFQILCEACNIQKSDLPGVTGSFYVPWWDY